MNSLEWFARDRIRQFSQQLKSVRDGDFMFESAKRALDAIESEIAELTRLLGDVSSLGSTAASEGELVQACVTVNQKLSSLTTYLGIVLRSSNNRNGFEYYYSLNEISGVFSGKSDRLVLSSEWEYSHFYIPRPPEALREFVFIGFPAYLSRNSLLLPLAAHELAHSIWRIRDLEGQVYTNLDLQARRYVENNPDEIRRILNIDEDLFADTLIDEFVGHVLDLAIAQAEEVFCDCFGVALFKESYIYAFNSFVLPGFGTRVSSRYPALHDRVRYILDASSRLDLSLRKQPGIPVEHTRKHKTATEVADHIVAESVGGLTSLAIETANEMSYLEGDAHPDIEKALRARIPAIKPKSPIEVLRAAWNVYLDWQDGATSIEAGAEQFRIMNNLCLKSLESYEIAKTRPF